MGIAHNVEGRGIIAYDRDELADAAAFVAEAVELFARFGNLGCCAHALESAAVIVGQTGQPRRRPNCSAPPTSCGAAAARATSHVRSAHATATSMTASRPSLLPHARPRSNAGRQHTLESAARAALDALAAVAPNQQ